MFSLHASQTGMILILNQIFVMDKRTDLYLTSSPDSPFIFKAIDLQSFVWESIISEVRPWSMSALLGQMNLTVNFMFAK